MPLTVTTKNRPFGGFTNPSISASTATGFLVVVAFMSAFVPRLVTCAGSGASRATWTLGMDVPFVPFVPPKSHWGCFKVREWGTCKTSRKEHPNKQHFLRKNMNHVTMSKACVQNNFLPHLACFKFGNCVKKATRIYCLLKLPAKTGNKQTVDGRNPAPVDR